MPTKRQLAAQRRENLARALARAQSALADRTRAAQATVVEAGAALEDALDLLPSSWQELRTLLESALDALQLLYQGEATDARALAEAVAGAVAAALASLGNDEAGRVASIRALNKALAQAIARSRVAPPADAPPGGLTLDTLVGRLVQLHPEDRNAVMSLRRDLERLAAAPATPALVALRIRAACRSLEQLLARPGPEYSAVLRESYQVLQDALALDSQLAPAGAVAAASVPTARPPELFDPARETDASLVEEFISESREHLDSAEAAILGLEADPEDRAALDQVFRALHTIKGTAGLLGIASVSDLAHRAESVLSRVREGELPFTSRHADLTLRAVDVLRELLRALSEGLPDAQIRLAPHHVEVLRQLDELQAQASSGVPSATSGQPHRLGDILVSQGTISREQLEAIASAKGDELLGMALIKAGLVTATDIARALRAQRRLLGLDSAADSWVRVRTAQLDRLFDLVGQLVAAHTLVARDGTVAAIMDHELSDKLAQLGTAIHDLQALTMSMRMVPAKSLCRKLERLVRDVARKSGKLVTLVTTGDETEIDRSVADLLADPLVHLIRNAIDHGIEPPDDRERLGKPRTGSVALSLYYKSGRVVVRIQDDGRGLDRARIRQKAVERGLIAPAAPMPEHELLELLFEPGFSTAEQVSDISGRGVGLDVVRRNVQALGGRIEVASLPGQGTTFVLKVPFSLATTDGLILRVGKQRYVVPAADVSASFRPHSRMLFAVAGRGEFVMHRDELIPMVRLHRLHSIDDAITDPAHGLLLVLGSGGAGCALLVDDVAGQQQVLVRTRREASDWPPGTIGEAILGDGSVALLLDSFELVRLARVGADPGHSRAAATHGHPRDRGEAGELLAQTR